jgi:large subunit ribosomal protein L13
VKTQYKDNELLNNDRKWYLVDAKGLVVGRVASKIANILRGKHNPAYAPHQDCGDFVIIVNAEHVRLTGNKENVKTYFTHTTRPGSARFVSFKQMILKHPEKVLENAIKGMLPKNALGRQMYRKLHVYAGESHPHTAQKPELLNLNA